MKRLLLVIAGLSVISATAQEARVDLGRNAEMYVANHADGIPYKTSANKQSSSVAVGTAPNVYGTGFGPKTNIWADEDLNTIVSCTVQITTLTMITAQVVCVLTIQPTAVLLGRQTLVQSTTRT